MRGLFPVVIVIIALAADTFSLERGSRSTSVIAVIEAIAAHADAEGVSVEITLSKPVTPKLSTVENPERLVFDFAGCRLAHSIDRVVVNYGSVRAVRTSEFSANPRTARVVIDLAEMLSHSETYSGNKLVIKLESGKAVTPASASGEASAPTNGSSVIAPKTTPITAAPSLPESKPGQKVSSVYALMEKARHLEISDLELIEAKAKEGDLESETILALAYHTGTLLKANDAEAIRLLQDAGNRDFLAAEEALGIFYQNGIAVPTDKSKAVYWYTRAAKDGSLAAETNLALMYSTGDGVAKDYTEAWVLFRSAATAGDPTAQLNLAALYHRGEGVAKDDQQAATWLRRAAEQGSVRAMLEFADWELKPEHGSDLETAIVWYTKAAEQGDASSQAILGDIYVEPKFDRVDYAQAVKWYTMAAQQGQREAEFGLGTRYLLGQGVEQNFVLARRWLIPAADRGHPYAQLLLAKLFENGEGGPADTVAAAKYYTLAADAGLAEAQYRRALMLIPTNGAQAANRPQDRNNQNRTDLVSAYKLLVLAEDGVKESALRAEALRKSLSAEEIASAEHQIDEWRIAHLHGDAAK